MDQRDPRHEYARTAHAIDVVSVVAIAALGALGIGARWLGTTGAAAVFPGAKPMTVGTAFLLLLLATTIALDSWGRRRRAWAWVPLAVAACVWVAILAAVLGAPAVEAAGIVALGITPTPDTWMHSPVAVAGLLLVLVVLAIRLARPRRSVRAFGAWGSLLIGAAGVVMVNGYLFGVPFMLSIVPVTFPTAVALVLLGLSTLLRTGWDVWPVRHFVGESARARLLRNVLPMVLALLTLQAWTSATVARLAPEYTSIAWAVVATVSLFVAWLLVGRVASRLGTEVDRTESSLRQDKSALEEVVTERTAALTLTNSQLVAALRARSLFLANMSHELRTPLNSVIGFTGVLLSEAPGPVNEEQRRQLEMVQSSGTALLTLVNDVLDVSRIEAGEAKVSFERTEACELISEIVESLRLAADDKGLALEVDVESCTIVSDARKLRQIVTNLLTNAIKFTPKGRVWVSCRESGSGDNRWVVVRVGDTGPGIPAEQLEAIFGPFQQLTGEAKPQGVGLGLSISRAYAQLIGAVLTVESSVGAGSVFTLEVPVRPARDREPEQVA